MPPWAESIASASSSASRKRSHAEITRSRSQSASTSPQPSKRRRISGAVPASSRSTPPPQPRFVGDGLDFRQPLSTDMNGHNTIDLTLDDDDSPPPSPRSRQHTYSRPFASTAPSSRATTRAPPFPPARTNTAPPNAVVIDLSDDDDEDDDDADDDENGLQPNDFFDSLDDEDFSEETLPPPLAVPPSPEIQIISENPVPRPRRRHGMGRPAPSRSRPPSHPNPDRRLPSPPPYATPLNSMANFLRASTAALGAQVGHHMNQLFAGRPLPAHHPLLPFVGGGGGGTNDDFEAMEINLDYQMDGLNPAADPHSDDLEIVQDPDYKAPPVAKDGFVRTWEDHDVLVCAKCGDELATGENEVKMQVWAAKKCGHVYCGECAADRATTRGGNDRMRKKSKSQAHRYKQCQVEGCPAVFGSASQMFQIYL